MHKEKLIQKYHELEIKADHYSRTDWDAYTRVREEMQKIDLQLLDIYNRESDMFLLESMG